MYKLAYHITTSDHHMNSQLGLCAPFVKYDSGGEYHYNESQSVTWKYWLDFCGRVEKLSGEKYIQLNGDLCDLDSKSGQRITSNPADIVKIMETTLEPLLSNATYKFVIRGTEYHTGAAGFIEELFAQRIGAEKCIDTKSYSWYHLRQEIEGINFDIAHHTSIGNLAWTQYNTPIRTIYEIQTNCQRTGYPVPHIILRGHVHTKIDTENIDKFTRFIVTPSWQNKNSFAYKVCTNKITEFGGTIIEINNGKYDVENITYVPRKESIWTR